MTGNSRWDSPADSLPCSWTHSLCRCLFSSRGIPAGRSFISNSWSSRNTSHWIGSYSTPFWLDQASRSPGCLWWWPKIGCSLWTARSLADTHFRSLLWGLLFPPRRDSKGKSCLPRSVCQHLFYRLTRFGWTYRLLTCVLAERTRCILVSYSGCFLASRHSNFGH